MTRFLPIHKRGKMWGEIDPVALEIKMKRGPLEVVIDLKPLVRGIWEPVREIQVIELPPLPPGAGVEAVKMIAAGSAFNGGVSLEEADRNLREYLGGWEREV